MSNEVFRFVLVRGAAGGNAIHSDAARRQQAQFERSEPIAESASSESAPTTEQVQSERAESESREPSHRDSDSETILSTEDLERNELRQLLTWAEAYRPGVPETLVSAIPTEAGSVTVAQYLARPSIGVEVRRVWTSWQNLKTRLKDRNEQQDRRLLMMHEKLLTAHAIATAFVAPGSDRTRFIDIDRLREAPIVQSARRKAANAYGTSTQVDSGFAPPAETSSPMALAESADYIAASTRRQANESVSSEKSARQPSRDDRDLKKSDAEDQSANGSMRIGGPQDRTGPAHKERFSLQAQLHAIEACQRWLLPLLMQSRSTPDRGDRSRLRELIPLRGKPTDTNGSSDETFAQLADALPPSQRYVIAKAFGKPGIALAKPFDSEFLKSKELGSRLQELQEDLESSDTQDCGSALRRLGLHIKPPPVLRELKADLRVVGALTPRVQGVGIGDLVVAREKLVGYELQEISHIENVLPKEERRREHESLERLETLVETETVAERDIENELEKTERFQLQAESQRVIDEELKIDAGVDVSADYGTVKVDASFDVGYTRSTHESQRVATEFGKQVTERSVERIKTRTRELRRQLRIVQVTEKNIHALKGLPDRSYSGIYQWVQSIHEVQLRHYGKRLILELFIPEPAAFLTETKDAPAEEVPAPPPLRIGPADIDDENYQCLAALYGADGVEPPPAETATVGLAYSSQGPEDGNKSRATGSGLLKLPDGYVPYMASVALASADIVDDFQAFISVGDFIVCDEGFERANTDRPKQGQWLVRWRAISAQMSAPDGLPYAIRLYGHNQNIAVATLQVYLARSPERYEKWQLATYSALKAGWKRLMDAYQEAVARSRLERRVQVRNRESATSPASLRELERTELRKWAILTMRDKPFDFDGTTTRDGLIEIDAEAAVAQAPIVRFFEQAFEWDQMTFFLQPYFWGRPAVWDFKLNSQVADEQHRKFLAAGSARAFIPVTPGFEKRVLHFLSTPGNETDRVRWQPQIGMAPMGDPAVWQEIVVNVNKELTMGSGTLTVTSGSLGVVINADSSWSLETIDLGRELWIEGVAYHVTKIKTASTFDLDRAYEGRDQSAARYVSGSVPFGAPWRVSTPTSLVALSDEKAKVRALP